MGQYKRAEENDLLREIKEYKEIEKYFIKENKKLQNRINKAIEYIEYNACCLHDEEILKDLLNILQGSDKE